jgi:DNA-binding transcriptional ArsR family regulator
MPSALGQFEPTAFGISAKMAKAVADPWRVRILAELSVRPLSPSRFVEEVGGELTEIARYFRQLADWGYVEVVEERPGRRRGAAIEHVYRGVTPAYFDASAWKEVSRPNRDAVSSAAVSSYCARVSEAIQARTFDEELDRHLSWDNVALDRTAWKRLAERLDALLGWLSALELEAAARLKGARREEIPTIVGLSSFRSPRSPTVLLQASRHHDRPTSVAELNRFGIGPKLAKALSNKWRCRILMELTSRPMSPSQFVAEIGGSKSHIARCFRELAAWGYVEVFEERKGGHRRGGVELIYRNLQRPHFDSTSWIALPRLVREEMSQAFLNTYFEHVFKAMDAGTFDAESDRHFSWKPLVLDRLAWAEVGEALDQLLAWLPSLEKESTARTGVRQLIPTVVGLTSFRSPEQAGAKT